MLSNKTSLLLIGPKTGGEVGLSKLLVITFKTYFNMQSVAIGKLYKLF